MNFKLLMVAYNKKPYIFKQTCSFCYHQALEVTKFVASFVVHCGTNLSIVYQQIKQLVTIVKLLPELLDTSLN